MQRYDAPKNDEYVVKKKNSRVLSYLRSICFPPYIQYTPPNNSILPRSNYLIKMYISALVPEFC